MTKFNSGYEEQLREQYPNCIVDQIVKKPFLAETSFVKGADTPYVHVSCPANSDTALYIPGFGEGIVNKASFAAEAALNGIDFVLPGQSRKQTFGDATDIQANNYLSVYHDLKQEQKPNVFIAHSFGAQILERMVQKSPLLFKEADVVLLAPSGTILGETYPELAKRWLKFMKSEADQDRHMEFPDRKNVTVMASTRVLASNPIRTYKEVRALRHGIIDYSTLRQNVGSLAVVSYGHDEMFPSRTDEDDSMNDKISASRKINIRMGALVNVFKNDILWCTPYHSARDVNGEVIGARGSTHDDEQFAPERVVGTVTDILDYQRRASLIQSSE